ncbi:hypothetical protein ACP70R_018809 [Stipagrostis hirtigluma subsp. patula]
MAHLSPSPSGGSSRRLLSELLEQQQEPFSLDLYLLEKGCSPALLDAAAGGAGACSPCWPRTRSAGGAPWRPAAASKNGSGGTLPAGVLRLLVSRILRAAATAKRKQPRKGAIDWGRVVAGGKPKRSSAAKNAAVPSSRPRRRAVEAGTGEAEEEEAAEDDGSSKQLSPVSVLEHRLFEQPTPPPHAQKAGMVVIIGELLPAACTPTLLDLLANAKSGNISDNSKDSRRSGASPPAPAPTRNNRARRQHVSKEEFATVADLVASEMAAAAWAGPRHLQPERGDVAGDIAAAVLDALTEETAAELMATGHDCAGDTATGRCCCGRC